MNAKIFNRLVDKVKRGGASVCADLEYDEVQARIDSDVEIFDDLALHVEGYAYCHKEFENGYGISPSYTEAVIDYTEIENVYAFNPNDMSDDTEDLTDEQQREFVEVLNEYLIVEIEI